jgi:cytochrome c peroxidase
VTPQNWGIAIGAYERTLVSPSRFDAWLLGASNALTDLEQSGLRTFIRTGCAGCHDGVGIGGGRYRKFGVVEPVASTETKTPDQGRIEVTHDPSDAYVFKVPTLRNVTKTAPYFHDGSVASLPEAIRVMARVQLGKTLSGDEVNAIAAFLESLSGAIPQGYLQAPELPAATASRSPR